MSIGRSLPSLLVLLNLPDVMQLGGQLFKGHGSISSEKYRHLDQIADTEEDIDPNIPKVTGEHRDILKYAPKWTTWPDFEQVRWVNSTIEWLWPFLARGIKKMVCPSELSDHNRQAELTSLFRKTLSI
jgi:hypothetical protein